MKIQIVNSHSGNWYTGYIDNVFEVEKNNTGYTLLYTPENESIVSQEPDIERRAELLKRLRNIKRGGMKLGVGGEHAIEITNGNNKDFSNLLSKGW
jgi:hypothetical protein